MNISIQTPIALLALGLTYLVVPGATLVLLRGRYDWRSTLLWCSGGLAMGTALLTAAVLRPASGSAWSLFAFCLGMASFSLRCMALERELHGRPKAGQWAALGLAAVLLQVAAAGHSRALFMAVGTTAYVAFLVALTRFCVGLGRERELRSARLMALSYGGLALVTTLRTVLQWLGVVEVRTLVDQVPVGPVVFVWLLAAVYGNLGFLGLALERLRLRAMAQARDLAHVQARRATAEQESYELSRMLRERDEMLQVLAHEVRQPLNNAQAALQSAEAVLDAREAHDAHPARQRVRHAQDVIGEAVGTLDNTLAAASLLSTGRAVARHDQDIDTLLALTLADLPPAERRRVRVERDSAVRTARFDPGLLRLALRNLLLNALAYSPPGSPVLLSVLDQEEPLALALEVADEGGGIAPELLPRLFQPGVRGSQAGAGHGMGLHIVRRVAELHDGLVGVRPRSPAGSVFRLELPQGRA